MRTTSKLAAALVTTMIAAAPSAWAQAYESCYRSKYGAEDQAGALNTITPAMTLAASKLVKQGKAMRMFCHKVSKCID